MTIRSGYNSNSNSSFNVSGFYRGIVKSVGSGVVSLVIPNLSGPTTVYENIKYVGFLPSVDDYVWVSFIEGKAKNPLAFSLDTVSSGDITAVTAGTALSGGGSSGDVTLNFAPSELSSVTVATDDKVVIADTSDSDNPKHVTAQSIANLASASPGGSDHQVQFNDNSSFGGDANFTYDGSAVGIGATLTVGVNDTGHDVKFFGATDGKYMEWDESDDQLDVTGKLDVTGETTITHSTGNYVLMGGNGNEQIKLVSDNGTGRPYIAFHNQDASGTLDRKGYIGFPQAASDSSTIYIRSDQGVIDMSATEMTSLTLSGNADFNGDLDVDGTTNLDVVDIDGAVDMASTLNVATSVGIGTTSPVGQLSVDSQNRQISIIDSGTTNYAEIRAHAVDSATSYANVNYNAYSHNFVIEGDRKLYIDNNGDVLPDTDSEIDLGNSSRYFANAFIDSIYVSNEIIAADGSSSDPAYCFSSDNSAGMYLVSSGTLGWSIAAAELYMNATSLYPAYNEGLDLGKSGNVWNHFWLGQADTFSSGGYYTLRSKDSDRKVRELVSSERFKKDIVDLPLSEAYKVLDARVIKYRGADDDSSVPLEVGLSAESLHNAGYEYAVRYDEGHWGTTPRSIYYEYLTAPLIAIIKDLKARIEVLEG